MILSGETNKVFFSAHLKADYPVFFRRIASVLRQYGIAVDLLGDTADYWCRDYMPIQVGTDRFVKYRYSPDYLDDPALRCYVTNVDKAIGQLGITPNKMFDLEGIVLDGGNVVKTPFHVIMTENVIVVPRLGIAADQLAYNQLRSLFNVPVEPIPAPGIIRKYGGAFNCLSWNIKTACQR